MRGVNRQHQRPRKETQKNIAGEPYGQSQSHGFFQPKLAAEKIANAVIGAKFGMCGIKRVIIAKMIIKYTTIYLLCSGSQISFDFAQDRFFAARDSHQRKKFRDGHLFVILFSR